MAIEEKLLKSLEFLKNTDYTSGDVFHRNRDKMQNCAFIVDTLTSHTAKVLPNFQHLLSTTFETLFLLCNDNESDLRLTAEESLNKIIKATDGENMNRVLMELHKELKKNGPVRSLRAALLRFSNMAHLIRLPKRKQYLISIMPCIVSISERQDDDLLHESLMKCLPKILKSLGNFLSETDVKTLLNTFLSNIGNSSPIIRRANANCLVAVCLNCRKPYQLLSHLLDTLLDLIITAPDKIQDVSVFTVLGVLNCLKLHLPYMMKKTENIQQEIQGSFGITKKNNIMQVDNVKVIQVYQMCLHFLLCHDDSVMSAALDTLNTFLQNCTPEIKSILLSSDGIKSGRLSFPSHFLLIKSVSKSQKIESQSSSTTTEENFERTCETRTFTRDNHSTNLDGCLRCRTGASDELCSVQANYADIGSFNDKNVSLLYCVRLVCKSCILAGRPNNIIPDAVVRITLKNLAMTCLSSIFSMYPSSFLLYLLLLEKNNSSESISGDDGSHRDDGNNNRQPISDIMLLADHSDPQLRGAVRHAVASYLKSALAESNGCYEEWCLNNTLAEGRTSRSDIYALKNIITFIKEGLLDESSNCVRQVLSSVTICLQAIVFDSSNPRNNALPLLELLPALSKHSHWLIKVKLLDVIVKLPFLSIESIAGDVGYQNKIVFDVVFLLLTDEDRRVRTAAIDTLIRIIPSLYTERRRKPIEREAVERIRMYFRNQSLNTCFEQQQQQQQQDNDDEQTGISSELNDSDMPFPFDVLLSEIAYRRKEEDEGECYTGTVVDTLSIVISSLYRRLKENSTDNTIIIIGHIEALDRLSVAYPTTVFGEVWDIDEMSSSSSNLERFVRSVLFENELVYDIHFHIHVLRLYGNLLAGAYIKNLYDIIETTNIATKRTTITAACESFLSHMMKLLNMFVHLVQNTSPPITAELKAISTNSVTQTQPGSSSPLKAVIRKSSDVVVASIGDRRTDDDEKSSSTSATEKKHHESTKAATAMALGYFSNSVHYMKIYSRLKISFAKYKTTLNYDDDNEPEDIIAFLRTLLTCFGQILEITGVTETSKIAEEILSYMQTIFHLEPTCTITCVHQLLKSLFGSNLVESHRSDIIRTTIKQQKQRQNENQRNADRQDDNDDDDDSDPDTLYYVLSRFHYENILNHFELIRSKWFSTIGNETYYDSGASSKLTTTPSSSPSFRKREKRQIGPNKSADKMLANYIRLFESMVIGSLKHYTITSDVQVQCAVLRLLNQLVRLKVNYCLLDSEQVFIKFIQKQFEYIEDGLVMNPEKLIPNMFDFLTSLSHGKQHSKSIIGVPKIIQLCDGLMASEQSPSTCCIPALKPIVEDVFLTRCSVAGNNATATTTGELDELEIAREVLLSMLLRLFEYAEVLDLLRIILLNEARRKTAADRWYKWSMQMWDVFVAKLTDCKLKLDNSKDMLAILRWLVALHPGLFRRSLSINELLAILFRRFPIKEKNIIMISRWLGKIIVIMTIVVQLSEAELLKATRESLSNFSPEGTFDCISDRIIKSDPLNVTKVENDLQGFNVESVFAKFIFRVLEIATAQCALAARQSQDTHFLVEQLSHLLFICCEIYQSDNYPILLGTSIDLIAAAAHRDSTTTTVSPYRDMLETIDGHIFNMGKKCPILIYQWCAIRNMLKIEKSATTVSVNSTKSYFIRSVANTKDQLYLTLTTSALLFSYSEYLIEEAAYKETLSEFIQVNVFFIVWYCEEPPITELISIIHRDITTSRILIEHISNMIIRQSNILEPHFIIRLLNVLQNCHESHTGSLIMLLTIDVIRRCCRHLAVLRMVVNVTCRKLEYLLTLHVDEIRRQMSESDLNRIVHHIVETKLASMKKNKTILGLLSKLSVQIYATNQQQQSIAKLNVLNAPVTTGFGYVRDMKIDKRWYLDWLTEKKNRILCICSTDDEGETNEALCQMINVEDVAEINEKKDDQEIKTIFLTNVLKVFATNMVNRGGDVDGSRTSQNKPDRKKNPLLQMSIHTVFNDIAMFLKKYREEYRRHRHSRRQHQIQDFEDRRMTTSSEEYSRQNVTLLEEQEEESGNVRRRNLIEIVKIVTTSFAIINRQICDDDDDESTLSLNRSLLVSFCVVCLESIASTVRAGGSINVDYVSNVLECTERMLRVPQLTLVLTLRSHLSWLCSIVDSLHRLLVHFCPSPDDYGNDTDDDDEAIITAKRATISNVGGGGRGRRQWTMEKKIQRANRQLEAAFIMVTTKNAAASARRTTLPRYLYSNVKSIVIRIATMSPFKSYLLTPTNLWKGIVRPAVVCATATVTNEQDDDDDAVDGTASNQTITEELLPPPPLPVDFLKDYDILSEYNFRITQLGWTDRKDFEETWMSLLSILNSDLIEDRSGSSTFSSSSTCFVIKVVTALLGRTLMSDTTTRALINTSCINESATFFHVPRDLPIWPTNEEVSLTKLKCVQDKLELLLKKKKNKMGGGNYGSSLLAATNVNVVTNVFNKSNVEKLVHDDSLPSSYYCGQISVAYLLLTLRKGTVDGEGEEEDVIDDDDEEENYPLMKLYNGRRAKEAHLDINSCIQSLLDIYTQWLQDSNKVKNVPVTLRTDGNDGGGGGCSCSILNEVLKSILVVSDLFHHRSQFCWMLDTLVELVKTHTHHQQHQQQQQQHSVMEDDIISNRYLIVGICKAVAVLNPDMEIYELIKRILNHNLIKRSSASSISVRLSCFYGLLYMLEGCVLNNTVIGGLTEELQFVLSLAIQHIDYYNNSINKKDGKHRYDDDEECLEITVWALKFYIIENIHDNQLPSGFVNTTIQSLLPDLKVVGIVGGTSTRTTTTTPVNYTLHSSLMKAMERLVLKRRLPTNLREQTLNLALHNIKNGNTLQSFLAIQLMITCMYIGDDDDERKGEELSRTTSLRIKDRRTSPLSSSSLIESDDVVMTKNPDHLMRTIEKVSVIFERIRRGLPLQDVEILSRILPHIIEDFFSPADILTKIVGEFLSPQQKYPALLSRVLFVVFGKGIERSQLPLLQDWVVISLSNFTQTLSTGTAVWYLTCFFISTSENFWLRSVFAYVRSRFGGRLEMEDREMLCIAGRDFYNRLASDRQRRIFIDTFKKAAEDDRRPSEESLPFRDLLDVCSSSP